MLFFPPHHAQVKVGESGKKQNKNVADLKTTNNYSAVFVKVFTFLAVNTGKGNKHVDYRLLDMMSNLTHRECYTCHLASVIGEVEPEDMSININPATIFS